MRVPAGSRHRVPQQGVVLFVSLIVLVAMTLAAIALLRSVDTANLVAGNVAFKSSTLNTTDQGIETAYRWLVTNVGTPALNMDNPAAGYFSSRPGVEPDWNDPSSWANAACVNGCTADANGNLTYYLIHRMCTQSNTAYNGVGATGQANECATLTATGTSSSGNSNNAGSFSFQSTPQLYYRVTARVVGPRNATSVVQSMIVLSN